MKCFTHCQTSSADTKSMRIRVILDTLDLNVIQVHLHREKLVHISWRETHLPNSRKTTIMHNQNDRIRERTILYPVSTIRPFQGHRHQETIDCCLPPIHDFMKQRSLDTQPQVLLILTPNQSS